jgi:GR25 family glycosyltransferase involved in LPS biosynthesis
MAYKQAVGWFVALCIFVTLVQLLLEYFSFKKTTKSVQHHDFNVSKAFVISLHPTRSHFLKKDIKEYLNIEDTIIFEGINGTHAFLKSIHNLSIFTKYLMLVGRQDHMQLSNTNMLGCLLSHIEIWRQIKPGETIAIFEEDAYFDSTSTERLYLLDRDLKRRPWDVLMLESGHFIATGSWDYVGEFAASCANQWWKVNSSLSNSNSDDELLDHSFGNLHYSGIEYTGGLPLNDASILPFFSSNICTWFGTRGYLITYEGSQKLLKYAFPIHVQIDALMGLVDAFEPDFKMYWTTKNVVYQQTFYVSQIWEACFKCYMPTQSIIYICFIILFVYLLYRAICKSRGDIFISDQDSIKISSSYS